MLYTFRKPETIAKDEKVERFEATLDDIFSEGFMARYTDAGTIGRFFIAGGFMPEDMQEIQALPRAELDEYVRWHTDFESWDQMLLMAVNSLLTQMDII